MGRHMSCEPHVTLAANKNKEKYSRAVKIMVYFSFALEKMLHKSLPLPAF